MGEESTRNNRKVIRKREVIGVEKDALTRDIFTVRNNNSGHGDKLENR